MATYKIEPISGDDYRLEVNDDLEEFTGTRKIHLKDIPGLVHTLTAFGFRAEKIEWHCIDK